jgi:hypothetical protein
MPIKPTRKSTGSIVMIAGVLFCVLLSFLTGTGAFVAAIFAVMIVLGLICSVNDTEPSRWTL